MKNFPPAQNVRRGTEGELKYCVHMFAMPILVTFAVILSRQKTRMRTTTTTTTTLTTLAHCNNNSVQPSSSQERLCWITKQALLVVKGSHHAVMNSHDISQMLSGLWAPPQISPTRLCAAALWCLWRLLCLPDSPKSSLTWWPNHPAPSSHLSWGTCGKTTPAKWRQKAMMNDGSNLSSYPETHCALIVPVRWPSSARIVFFARRSSHQQPRPEQGKTWSC